MATGSSCATKRLQRAAWHVACFTWRARLCLLAHALAILSTVEIWWYHCRGVSVYFVPVVASSTSSLLPKACWRWSCKSGDPEIQPLLLVKIFANNATHIRDGILEYNPLPCCLVFNPDAGNLVWSCRLYWQVDCDDLNDLTRHWSDHPGQWSLPYFQWKRSNEIRITITILSHPESRISVQLRISRLRAEFLPEVFFAKTEITLNPNFSGAFFSNFSRHTWKNRRISELRLDFPGILSAWLCHDLFYHLI